MSQDLDGCPCCGGIPTYHAERATYGHGDIPTEWSVRCECGILRAKADQHPYVLRKLLATGDRTLIENSWRDSFWGWGPNRDGQNVLGKLWMEVRAELRAEDAGAAGGETRKPWHAQSAVAKSASSSMTLTMAKTHGGSAVSFAGMSFTSRITQRKMMNTEYGPIPEPSLPKGRYGYRMAHVNYFTEEQLMAFAAQQVAAANARVADAMDVLRMVDDNNRVDAGEDRKAWRGDFVEAEVRRVLGDA